MGSAREGGCDIRAIWFSSQMEQIYFLLGTCLLADGEKKFRFSFF
jgi:hypothetical protein